MLGLASNKLTRMRIKGNLQKNTFLLFFVLSLFVQSCISSVLDEIKKIDAVDEVITNTPHSIPLVYSDLQASRFFFGMDKNTFKTIGGQMFITSTVDINPRNSEAPYDLTKGQVEYSSQFDYKPKYSKKAKDAIAKAATFFGTERDTTTFFVPVTYKDMSLLDSLWQVSTAIKVKFEIPYSQLAGDIELSFESIKGRISRKIAAQKLPFTLGVSTLEETLIFNNQVFTPTLKAGIPYLELKLISRLSFQGQRNMQDLPFRITVTRESEYVDKMFGKVKKKTFEFPTKYKMDFTALKASIKRIQNVFDVDFSHPYFKLYMVSNYGVNTTIDLKSIKVYHSGKSSALTGIPSSDPLKLIFTSNDQGVLVEKELEFLNANSNVDMILSRLPDSIVMAVSGEVYSGTQSFQKENFDSDQVLRGRLEVRFPFRGTWRQVLIDKTTPYRPITADKDIQTVVDSIKLFTTISNEMPVPAQISILLLDSDRKEVIKILENQLLDPAQIDHTIGRALSPRKATFFTNISKADVELYEKARYINVISVLSQNTDLRPVYIEPAQRIRISLKMSFFMKSIKI